MKLVSTMALFVFFTAFAGSAYAEANPLAKGVDEVTHAPFAGLKDVNSHLFSPVKDVNGWALNTTDGARHWTVRLGLNLGQPME